VFLSTASSKLATYALPLCPPIATLAAAAWWEMLSGHGQDRYGRAFSIPIAIQGVATLIVPVVAILVVERRYRAEYSALVWAGVLVIAGGAVMLMRARRSAPTLRVLISAVSLVAAMALFAILVLLPAAAARNSAHDLAAFFNDAGAFPERLRLFEDRVGSVVFYLDPAMRAQLTPERLDSLGPASLKRIVRNRPDRLTLAVRERRMDVFVRLFDPDLPYQRAGQFRLYDVTALSRTAGAAAHAPVTIGLRSP
jgi:4-amino-4-deoxy-L-arabinose transferase-like glycosyltransferase